MYLQYNVLCISPSTFYYVENIKTASVLGREEGYTMKYSMSPREIPRAKPERFPEGSVKARNPVRKILPFRKIALTLRPMMQFLYPLRFGLS